MTFRTHADEKLDRRLRRDQIMSGVLAPVLGLGALAYLAQSFDITSAESDIVAKNVFEGGVGVTMAALALFFLSKYQQNKVERTRIPRD